MIFLTRVDAPPPAATVETAQSRSTNRLSVLIHIPNWNECPHKPYTGVNTPMATSIRCL